MDLPSPTAHRVPADWVPVQLCTLPTAEQPLRVAAFDTLLTDSLRVVERPAGVPTRARLVLAGGADLPGRVQRLADAETACCSFFSFTVTARPGDGEDPVTVAVDIEVPVARASVLAALVARAEHVLGAAA